MSIKLKELFDKNFKSIKEETFKLSNFTALIGNNILSTHATKPFNDNVINDFSNLKFIDVDDDSNTFSSSEANLNIIERLWKR